MNFFFFLVDVRLTLIIVICILCTWRRRKGRRTRRRTGRRTRTRTRRTRTTRTKWHKEEEEEVVGEDEAEEKIATANLT